MHRFETLSVFELGWSESIFLKFTLRCSNYQIDFKVTSSGCHSVKVLSTKVVYSVVAMETDLCFHLTHDTRGAWQTMYDMLLSNYKGDAS